MAHVGTLEASPGAGGRKRPPILSGMPFNSKPWGAAVRQIFAQLDFFRKHTVCEAVCSQRPSTTGGSGKPCGDTGGRDICYVSGARGQAECARTERILTAGDG